MNLRVSSLKVVAAAEAVHFKSDIRFFANFDFTSDIWTQALLNYLLSQSIGICDGVLFDKDNYPSNSSQIYQIAQQYICDFDSRF